MQSTSRTALSVLFVLFAGQLVWTGPVAAVKIQFDYQYDDGFFDDPLRRELMEMAADQVNRWVDTLDAIEPTEDNQWFSFVPLPPAGAEKFLRDTPIPEDTLLVITGGNSILPTLTLSVANVPEAAFVSGDDAWRDLLTSRGEPGALETPSTDYGGWGGVIMWNSDEVNWHFGKTTEGLDPDETDFLTVAMHELAHILGFGPAASFGALVEEGDLLFTGEAATAVGSPNNRNLGLHDGGHWREGTVSTINGQLQEALLGPVIQTGERRFMTDLDFAALQDVGWELASAGDANRDRRFDMLDLVQVQQSNKYRVDELAGWSEGDWNGDLRFDQLDLVDALTTGIYPGPYPATSDDVDASSLMATVVYDPATGELGVETPVGLELTSISIDSASAIFVGQAQNLGGTFDLSSRESLFKATFGSSFGTTNFGPVAKAGLSFEFLSDDLTFAGSRLGGGVLGDVELRFIPEPTTWVSLALGALLLISRPNLKPQRIKGSTNQHHSLSP